MDSIKKIIELVPRVTDAKVIRKLSYPANKGLLTFERLDAETLRLTITKDFNCLKSHTDVIRKKFMIDSDNKLYYPETMIEFMKSYGVDSLFRGSVIYRTIRQVQALSIVGGQTPVISRVLTSLINEYELSTAGDGDDVMYRAIVLSCLLGDPITFKHKNGVVVNIRHKHDTTTSVLKIVKNGKGKSNISFSLGDGPLIFNKLIPEWRSYTEDNPLTFDNLRNIISNIRVHVHYNDELKDLVDVIVDKCNLKLPGGI